MLFTNNLIKSSSKMMVIAVLAIGASVSAIAQDTSVVTALKNDSAAKNTALNPGHSKHDKDGDGRDEHMDGKKGNGYGHDKGGKGGPPQCVPEPGTFLAIGLGAGFLALKKFRAAKKA